MKPTAGTSLHEDLVALGRTCFGAYRKLATADRARYVENALRSLMYIVGGFDLPTGSESDLLEGLAKGFAAEGIPFRRHVLLEIGAPAGQHSDISHSEMHPLDRYIGRIDFLIENLAVLTWMDSAPVPVARRIARYLFHRDIAGLLLVTPSPRNLLISPMFTRWLNIKPLHSQRLREFPAQEWARPVSILKVNGDKA